MWSHPATQENVRRLRDDFGYAIVEPDAGPARLRAGRRGAAGGAAADRRRRRRGRRRIGRSGRRIRPTARRASSRRARPTSTGRRVLITAGGTAEPIDPVRFIGNRSTGKMGVAIAEAALDARRARDARRRPRHASPCRPTRPIVRVETTAEMRDAVLDILDASDALVMAAAVADFRPRRAATTKLTRDEGLTLELEPTEDILAGAAAAVRRCRRPHAAADPRRIRRRDRLARPGRREAPPEGRRPPRRQRRRGGRLGLRDRHEPGHDPRRRRRPEQALPLLAKRAVADVLLDRVAARAGRA